MDSEHRIPVGNNPIPVRNFSRESSKISASPLPMSAQVTPQQAPKLSFPAQKMPSESTMKPSQKDGMVVRALDKVITMCLVAFFFGLPLFFTGMTLQGIAFEKQLFFYFWLLIGVVCWVSRGVLTGEMKIKKTPLDIPIAFFLIVYSLSAAFSVDKWHSFWGVFGDPSRGVLNIFSLVIAYYFIVSHCNRTRVRIILASYMASVILVEIWTLLVAFGIHFMPQSFESRAPLSLFGSMTSLMLFIGSALPLGIAMISHIQSSDDRSAFSKISYTAILLLAIIFTFVLMLVLFPYVSWLAILGGFAVYLLYILAKVIPTNERFVWLPMLSLVLLLGLYMTGLTMNGFNGFAKTYFPVEATPNMSLSWEVAKASLKENLFLGSGPGMFGHDFSLFKPQSYNLQPLNALRFTQGKGLFFEALSTIGLVGVISFIILLLTFLSVGFFLLTQKREHDKSLSLGLWSTMMIISIAMLIIPFNGSILIMGTLLAALTLAVMQMESQSEESHLTLSLASSPKYALALAFVFLVVSASVAFTFAFIGRAYWADVLAAQSMQSSLDNTTGIDRMTRAVQIMPQESRYRSLLGQIYLALARQEMNKSEGEQDATLVKNYVDSAVHFSSGAHAMSPRDIVIQETYAQTLENALFITGIQEETLHGIEKAYQEASSLEPHNPFYYIKLGQIKKALSNMAKDEDQTKLLDEAEKLFLKAIDENPEVQVAYFNSALTQEARGATDDAIKSLIRGIEIDRKSKDAEELKYNLARILRVRGKDTDLKNAESLLKEVIESNNSSVNSYVTLGLVYEQTNRKNEALEMYQKALTLINEPDTSVAKKQIQILIDTLKSGKSDVTEISKDSARATNNAGAINEDSISFPQDQAELAPNTTGDASTTSIDPSTSPESPEATESPDTTNVANPSDSSVTPAQP